MADARGKFVILIDEDDGDQPNPTIPKLAWTMISAPTWNQKPSTQAACEFYIMLPVAIVLVLPKSCKHIWNWESFPATSLYIPTRRTFNLSLKFE